MVTKLKPAILKRPMSGETLLAARDVPDRDVPPRELSAPGNLFVVDRLPAATIKKLGIAAGENAGAIFGQLGGSLEAAVLPKTAREQPADLEPHIPKWSGVAFAPRAATPRMVPMLRRRNGARVKPEYVFPPDGRKVYYPNAYPWRIIGRIFVWTDASAPNWSWSGSAALVGKNVILTASHVVPWGHDGKWKALFVPAYYDGASLYGSEAASWISSAHGYQDHDQGDDMAVMRLKQPLGDWLGYFGYKTYNDDWEDGNYWTLAGYPGDVANAERPSADYWFPITDDDNDGAGVELEYKADTNHGNSGGPVFGWWDGKPYVIGTHSGGEDNFGEPKQNVAAGGSALSALIAWARTNW